MQGYESVKGELLFQIEIISRWRIIEVNCNHDYNMSMIDIGGEQLHHG